MEFVIKHPVGGPAEKDGATWDTGALQAEFDVLGFLAPFVEVRRKSDGVYGSLQFSGGGGSAPRVYFGFRAERTR